jgi:AcrB/AcrD/AcrF family
MAMALDGEELAVNSSLNPIAFAMRHPVSVMAGVAALAVASALAVERMAVDVFPALDLPVIYIAQPYGGMDPSQMESQLTSYYEGHSIYMTGIHHVESKNIQGMAVIKLFFYPGTDMAGMEKRRDPSNGAGMRECACNALARLRSRRAVEAHHRACESRRCCFGVA